MTQPDRLREALTEALDMIFEWTPERGFHEADCHSIVYPGSPFQPPDPCNCGGDRITAVHATLAASPAPPEQGE